MWYTKNIALPHSGTYSKPYGVGLRSYVGVSRRHPEQIIRPYFTQLLAACSERTQLPTGNELVLTIVSTS